MVVLLLEMFVLKIMERHVTNEKTININNLSWYFSFFLCFRCLCAYVLEMNSNSDSYTLFDCSQKCQINKTIPDDAKSYDIKSSKLRSIIDNSSCNSRGDICNIEMKQKNGIVTGLSSISKLGEI